MRIAAIGCRGLAVCLLAGAACAQAKPAPPPAAPEPPAVVAQKLAVQAVTLLTGQARTAETAKVASLARRCLQLIVDHYDPANKAAKTGLERLAKATDDATGTQRRSVQQGWTLVAKKLGPQHRVLGQAFLDADELQLAQRHFELALVYDPSDADAHRALGHAEHDGFFGTDEQIAFVQRSLAIDQQAKDIAATDHSPQPLDAAAMPEELRRSGLAVTGARTRGFKVWTTSTDAQVAADIAQWGERAVALLESLFPGTPSRRVAAGVGGRKHQWLLVLRTNEEWQRFFAANPEIAAAAKRKEIPPMSNFYFASSAGNAVAFLHQPGADADNIIAHVTMWGFANDHNEGLGQGLVHTMTTLLVGTTLTWFGAEPATSASKRTPPPRDAKAWSARIREEVRAGQDWPIVQVPRERLESYREAVRVKSWSFVRWLMARYPGQWHRVFEALRTRENPMPETIEQVFKAELGRTASELEQEWREWASGDTPLARASGNGG